MVLAKLRSTSRECSLDLGNFWSGKAQILLSVCSRTKSLKHFAIHLRLLQKEYHKTN